MPKHTSFSAIALILASFLITGCTLTEKPRVRPGSYASSTATVKFLDADEVGSHNYRSFIGEHNGVVFTCRGGHIDLAHLRIAADNVFYLNSKVRRHLEARDTEFTYSLNTDPSIFHVSLTYPANFNRLPAAQRDRVIDEVSLELAQYFTWSMISWHEVLTWYGYKTVGFISEYPSAFSWEDPYSNLTGVILGARAVASSQPDFDEAMNQILAAELKNLDIQPGAVGYEASEQMRGKWFAGNIHTDMRLRNLDLGYDDGYVSPVMVPNVCNGMPLKKPIPTLLRSERNGFRVGLEIDPREMFKKEYLKIAYPDGNYGRIIPAIHMPLILNQIRNEALAKGYTVVPNRVLAVNTKPSRNY